ncbi:nSTAND1 domain-containing NTPase [Maribellus maritimus]|uniref:nSTAND1 domain-containing NTPase n=1 Tax=Maribellus maritimus TaxID=2870838 RepID=UPI001EECA336|nr:hypothetical protein [Maribellus maritimus]MCG6190964.1 hypothetical protein [Maribellus maritimus]
MQKKYPFKFLDSYQRNDKDFFFGRDEEIDELYQMIFQTKILVLYGTSGTGKTSLIQCGLANRFHTYDWLALYIRRGGNLISSLDKALCYESDEAFTYVEHNDFLIEKLPRKIDAVYKASFKPLYLIFDQFEELYVLGSKTEQEHFIKIVKEILTVDQPVKIILSIREEYLGYLYQFEKEVPQLLRKKLRVEPMSFAKLENVIRGINDYQLSLVKVEKEKIDEITEEIFKRLKDKETTRTIQLPYLQVFLDKLYINKTNDESHQADALILLEDLKNIGDIDDVLQDFLEEQVKNISRELSQNKRTVTSEIIWTILSNFCTLDGTKEPISKRELVNRLKSDLDVTLIEDSVELFTKKRILNKSEDEDLYELAHDSLALKITEKRSEDDISKLEVKRLIKSKASLKDDFREYFTEKQINFIEPYLDKIKSELTAEERKLIKESKKVLRRKRRRKKAGIYSLIGAFFILLIYSFYLSDKQAQISNFQNDIDPLKKLISLAETNILHASFMDKNPTLSLQLFNAAFLNLDSAKSIDTLRDKQYRYISSYIAEEYKKLDSTYAVNGTMVQDKADSVLKKDFALYKIVEPQNPEDTIFDIRFVNGIFTDRYDDLKFRLWHGEKDTTHLSELAQVVFPKDSTEAMALYKNGTVRYWGKNPHYRNLKMEEGDKIISITPIQYRVIGYKLLSAMNNHRLVEWNLNGTKRRSTNIEVVYIKEDLEFNDSIVSVAISPNRAKIFTASDKGIGIIWPADTSNVVLDTTARKAFNLLQDTVLCSVFSNNGEMIVTGSVDHSVKIWNAEDGELIKILNGHNGPVTSVAFSTNNKIVYTGALDKTFRRWRLPDTELVSQLDSVRWNGNLTFLDLFKKGILNEKPHKVQMKSN